VREDAGCAVVAGDGEIQHLEVLHVREDGLDCACVDARIEHQERASEAHANQRSFEGDDVGSEGRDHEVEREPWGLE
jgi:hypothetical protein